jgi:hypothetical protein
LKELAANHLAIELVLPGQSGERSSMIGHIVRSTLVVGLALVLAATTLSDGRVKQVPTVQETPLSAASDVERDVQKVIREDDLCEYLKSLETAEHR